MTYPAKRYEGTPYEEGIDYGTCHCGCPLEGPHRKCERCRSVLPGLTRHQLSAIDELHLLYARCRASEQNGADPTRWFDLIDEYVRTWVAP